MITKEVQNKINTLISLKIDIENHQGIIFEDFIKFCTLIDFDHGAGKIKNELINCINAEMVREFEKALKN